MESISPSEIATELLNHALRGNARPGDLLDALVARALDEDEALAGPASKALFGVLVERLADLFEPALCDAYAAMFARVLELALPDLAAGDLLDRYRQVRAVRPVTGAPRRVIVLSRVTLGADVAITSLVLDAAKRRFPDSEIVLAGGRKAWELFEMDSRLAWLEVPYGRSGLLRDRLSAFEPLRTALAGDDTIALDPDSRLTQLGLLPVCPPERHFLFESRSFGGTSLDTLPALTRRWLHRTLGVSDLEPYIAPRIQPDFGSTPTIAVSLGTGGNPAKRLEDPFEAELLRHLTSGRSLVVIDRGAGGEEAGRVDRAIAASGAPAGRYAFHEGPFASFAAVIAHSRMYCGYDSAGQHAAAVLGVPLISVFAGAVSDRMLARWSPDGPGPRTVIKADGRTAAEVLDEIRKVFPC